MSHSHEVYALRHADSTVALNHGLAQIPQVSDKRRSEIKSLSCKSVNVGEAAQKLSRYNSGADLKSLWEVLWLEASTWQ